MGTRHLVAVQIDGEYKVAQYGQWDGYPDGQGVGALDFLRRKTYREALKAKLKNCRFLTDDEIRAEWAKAGANPNENFVNMDVAGRFDRANPPYLSRDHGAEILRLVAESTGEVRLKNSIAFTGDSLFCEWAYVVDFDKGTFEVYEGFNEEPLDPTERFASTPSERKPAASGSTYHPVKLIATFPLDDLPSKALFLKATTKNDEESAA